MIEVKELRKTYPGRGGILAQSDVQAVKGVNFVIPDAGAVAFIGESGCGKTTIGRILSGLEPYDSGEIRYRGVNLSALSRRDRQTQLRKVQLIQQDPYAALNPSHTIAESLNAPLAFEAKRQKKSSRWIKERADQVLSLVGLDPAVVLGKYPHMLSGGQRQRVVIARALTVEPDVLVADEAVSMIDVSLRLGILNLLGELRERYGIALLFITHDVAAARYVGQDSRLYVIYQGQIVEEGLADQVIQSPVHPYTQALLSAVPVLRGLETEGVDRYIPLTEFSPNTEAGCPFAPRCRYVQSDCAQVNPPRVLVADQEEHWHRCLYPTARQVVAQPLTTAESH